MLARPAGVMQPQVAAWEITPHPGEPIINVGWPLRQTVGRAGPDLQHGCGVEGLRLLQLNMRNGDWPRYIIVDRLTDLRLIASFGGVAQHESAIRNVATSSHRTIINR